MRTCPACGHPNPDDVEICLNCAAALGRVCPACGQPAPAGNQFCGNCGGRLPETQTTSLTAQRPSQTLQSLRAMIPTALAQKITAAVPAIQGERREVTVFFADVANFTATAHALDSEEVYLFIDEAMRRLVDVVYKYEGTIDKFTGDGLMALFGAPVTHENDPERAVRAALEMLTVLQPVRERVKHKHNFDFQMRIGVNTGLVVAGQVGNDLHMEYTVIGDTVNLASRLQTAAEPESVLVSFTTFQRTQPIFNYRKLESLTVKGLAEPIPAFQPLSLRSRPGRVRGLAGMDVPMIGRQEALAKLRAALEAVVEQERSQIVLVTGEAGLGKSRLVAEFRRSITQPGLRVYEGSCLAYARSRPLWIVAEIVRHILRLSESDPVEQQRDALQAYVNYLGLPPDSALPYLSHMLGLEAAESGARLQLLDAAMVQRQTHAILRQVFLAEARRTPTVLIFDDLHWVDPASRDFLEYLAQTTDDAPLLLIFVSRDSERKTVIRSLVTLAERYADRFTDIQLQPLSPSEGRLLVEQLLQEATDQTRSLQSRIAARAEGNPFYIEEIIRMLIDQEGLTRAGETWQVTPKAEELMRDVPGTLKGLILTRFDRLPESLRRTLQKAAVVGRSFPVGLLQLLEDKPPGALNAALSELQMREFLNSEPFGTQAGYAFQHALVQEAVYGTLLKRDHQRLHDQIAQAIERTAFWLPDEQTEVLAYHYAESRTPARAVPFLIAAAENAARRYANETVIQHYRQAMALMHAHAPGREAELARVRLGLGQALKFVGDFAEAGNILREAMGDVRQAVDAGNTEMLGLLAESLRELADVRQREGVWDEAHKYLEAVLGALGANASAQYPKLWRSLIDRMAWGRFRQGKLDDAYQLIYSAVADLDPASADDPITLASLYNTLGGVAWQQGRLAEAAAYVERSLQRYQSLGYSFGMANAYTNLGILYYTQGLWPKAAENFERSDRLRHETGYIPGRAANLQNLGLLRMAMGDHAQAQKDLETSLTISQQLGEDFDIVHAEIGLAQLAYTRSSFKDAETHIIAAMERMESAGEDERIQAHWLWALAKAETGQPTEGLDLALKALQMAREGGLPDSEIDCLRVVGMLRMRTGEWEDAEAQLRASAALAAQENAYRQGHALYQLGRLYESWPTPDRRLRAERLAQADEVYTQAAALFENLGAAYDLQLARAALSALNAAREATTGPLVSPRLPQGEWHPAAVLWANVLTPPRADEETIFESIALVIPTLNSIVQEYEGHVIRRASGLTAVFGAQAAHEDDAERAVHAARRMAQHMNGLAAQGEATITLRLAVSYGDVVAGHIGSSIQPDFVVTGEPVQTAQRLAELAPPGQVWVSEAVQKAASHVFVFAPQPGKASVWQLVEVRPQPGLARGLPGTAPRLIGREIPLEAMMNLAENVRRGVGGLVWIEGEAGVGKSRLLREFGAMADAAGLRVWAGQCSAQKTGHAFALMTDLLARVLGVQGTDTPEQIRNRLHQALGQWPPEAQAARPYLELVMGLQPGGREGERLSGLEPDHLRQQIFVALRGLLKSMAADQPLAVLLDDLHWLDSASAGLLVFLSNLIASAPILFVCALRWDEAETPDDRAFQVQSMLRPAQTLRIHLDRLSEAETQALLSELLSTPELPTALRTLVLDRSEGNPYYVEEIIRTLLERGYLKRGPEGWDVDPGADLPELPLPTSLGALIHSRVDTLPPELKHLLQCVAVIGEVFEDSLLEAVSELPNVGAALVRLEARGMVRRAAQPRQWQFNHSLMETAVYETLLKVRRKALHLKVAETLERRWAGVEAIHAETLAYHFAQADEGGKALIYLTLAAEQAASRYATEEALIYFQQAAQRLPSQPDADAGLRWRIAAGLGDVHRFVGEYGESQAVLEAALPLLDGSPLTPIHRAGLYRRLGETAQKQGEFEASLQYFTTALTYLDHQTTTEAQVEAARILAGVAWTHLRQGRFDEARQAGEASLAYAKSADDLNAMATAENTLGGIYYQLGEWQPALSHTRQALSLREQMGHTWGVAAANSNLGILSAQAGDWEQAKACFQQSLWLRQEMGDAEGVAIVHNNLGTLAFDEGDLDRAEAHFRESLAVSTPLRMAYHITLSQLGLSETILARGDIEAAESFLQTGLAQAETIGAQDLLGEMFRVQAQIWMARSRWGEAREAAEKSAALATSVGDRRLEAGVWRVASEIELREGQLLAAREKLEKAWQAVSGITGQLEAGRVAVQAGQLSLAEGDAPQAEKHWLAAREIFARLGARLDLERAEAALRQLPGRQSAGAGTA